MVLHPPAPSVVNLRREERRPYARAMRRPWLLFSSSSFFALLLIAACGGTVETSPSASGTTGSGAAGASANTTGTSDATSGVSGTSGAGGSGGCDGHIDVTLDNGSPQHWASICNGSFDADKSDVAIGYAFSGGPVGAPHGLRIVGCATADPGSTGLTLSAFNADGPGAYIAGSTQYTDPSGGMWGTSGDFFHMTITRANLVGGIIEGSFSVIATQGGSAAHNLDGTFHVCHTPDLMAP